MLGSSENRFTRYEFPAYLPDSPISQNLDTSFARILHLLSTTLYIIDFVPYAVHSFRIVFSPTVRFSRLTRSSLFPLR